MPDRLFARQVSLTPFSPNSMLIAAGAPVVQPYGRARIREEEHVKQNALSSYLEDV
jgi:hypothetical protein